MPKKKNTIAKHGFDVVTFAGTDVVTLEEQHRQLLETLAGHAKTGPPILLTTAEVAQLCRCSESTLNKLRVYGGGPAYVKLRAVVRYNLTDVAAWLTRETRSSTSQTDPP